MIIFVIMLRKKRDIKYIYKEIYTKERDIKLKHRQKFSFFLLFCEIFEANLELF